MLWRCDACCFVVGQKRAALCHTRTLQQRHTAKGRARAPGECTVTTHTEQRTLQCCRLTRARCCCCAAATDVSAMDESAPRSHHAATVRKACPSGAPCSIERRLGAHSRARAITVIAVWVRVGGYCRSAARRLAALNQSCIALGRDIICVPSTTTSAATPPMQRQPLPARPSNPRRCPCSGVRQAASTS